MAKFAYNNAKNSNTGHTPFELNCSYHPCISFKEDTNLCSWLKSADELSAHPQDLITVCRKNIHHAQEFQKQAYNKGVKPRSYAPGDKIWLNSKYIKTKHNWKLEPKFFELFRVLHLVGKEAYKFKLPKRWRIHNIFYVLLLEQNTSRKERVNKRVTELETGNNKEYKVEAIWDSAVYPSKSESGQLPGLYYLIACKTYPKEENIWESLSAVYHFQKLISCFHKKHRKKPSATSPPINFVPLMVRPIVRLSTLKRK